MSSHEDSRDRPQGAYQGRVHAARWGAAGIFIVVLVVVLALALTLLGPAGRQQQAANWMDNSQSMSPPIP